MKTYLKIFVSLLTIASFISACGGGSDDSGSGDDSPTPIPVEAPEVSMIIFPPNNTVCNQGEILSDTQSRVTFEYTLAENTDTYEINLRNLDTNATQRINSTSGEQDINILRGTPYEWFIISRAEGTNETATSNSALFFNEGPGITNYAPFPAEAVQPTRGSSLATSTTAVTLEWSANDTDGAGDITGFEVFFGTDASNLASIATLETNNVDNVQVSAGTSYVWQVVTTDSHGNTSESEVFSFRVL